MSCDACATARSNPNTGRYNANCEGCKARAIARGTDLWEASRAGRITPAYRAALERVFCDRWKEGHELVKSWIDGGGS